MSKLLSTEKIIKIILDYIEDDRRNQAILLNGEWGCGKTFFIKEKLIPKIDKETYQTFLISLYGVDSVEKIQDIIYTKWIEKVLADRMKNHESLGDILAKGVAIFGKSAIKLLESKIGTEGSAIDSAKVILNQSIGTNKKPILIFDDLERCQIDIIELMGFLNNLSENNGYKLILVANEHEINRDESDIAIALKYGIALNSRLDIDDLTKKESNCTENDKKKCEIKINQDDLKNISNHYFGRKTTYERTHEKLIGLTIPYNISIIEAFDDIVSKYVKDENTRNMLKTNKDEIIDLFEREGHRNLRTLITASIAIEDIISLIKQNNISEKNIFNDELKTIVLYIVFSAIRRTSGKDTYNWTSNTRYGFVNSFSNINNSRLYGYAFIDEYWETQCIDVEFVYKDIIASIDEKVAIKKSVEEREEHRLLALNRLMDWYMLPDDDEVKRLVQQMKEELSQKKYYPQDFKEIILTLMRINNPNFGMSPDKKSESNTQIFDSTEGGQFVGMSVVRPKVVSHQYLDWEEINISEFVNLMLAYFDDDQFTMTKNMISVLSEDKQFVYNYRQLTMPLIKKIEQNEDRKISVCKNGISISDMPWDDDFEIFCRDSKAEFINQGRFLSLFGYDKLVEKIAIATPTEIHNFCYAVKKVYSFSNLADAYFEDYDIVKGISDYISENIDGLLHGNKSRVREIALRRLKSDMNKYEHSLKRTNLAK